MDEPSASETLSFIGDLLTRHPWHEGRWPGEDLLTEATAAVFRQVPALAGSVAGYLVGAQPFEAAEAITQKRAGDGRVDLQLLVPQHLMLWVEVKDWSRESGDQLAAYLAALAAHEGAAERRLVYLNRLGGASPSREDVRLVRWQDLGGHIGAWLSQHEAGLAGWERGLVSDYLAYLKERDLAVSDPVPQDLERVVEEFQATREALDRLHSMTRDRVSLIWQPITAAGYQRTGGTTPASWPSMWWSVYEATPSERFPNSDFDFALYGFYEGDNLPARIVAGLIYREEQGTANPFADSTWIRRMETLEPQDSFGRFRDPAAYGGYRLYRELPLTDLPATNLSDQADMIADFVNSTFRLIRDGRAGRGSP